MKSMSKPISRRHFLKYSTSAALGLSWFSLAGVALKSRAFGQTKSYVPAEQIISNLQALIPQLLKNNIVPGASIAVVREGQILWSRGVGVKNTQTGQPVDENTVFAAASLSKPVFAYAVMKLAEQGQLDLEKPLTKYTIKPYINDPRIEQITARMVLSHTTGFPNWSGYDPVWIDFTPGSRFSYSSEGFLYLQTVVERITQQPFNDYMRNQVFTPLRMENSSYLWMNSYDSLAANGHDYQGKPFPLRKPTEAMSAGSLRTTATDYAKFLMAMMEPAANDAFLLNETSLNQMVHQNISINQSLGWGLGWGVEHTIGDGDFFWHWGDSGVYKSFTLGSRNLRTGMVILTNGENGLRICRNLVTAALGGQHPAFDFDMIDY